MLCYKETSCNIWGTTDQGGGYSCISSGSEPTKVVGEELAMGGGPP